MSGTIKKVAQIVAKGPQLRQVTPQPPVQFQKLGDNEQMKVLRPPRAVEVEEIPTILPARESNKTTMMPWKGWFQNFLKEKVLSESQFKTFRSTFFFYPDDIYDLEQSPKLAQKIPIGNDPNVTHNYRQPSPGSQPGNIRNPTFEEGEDPYDVGYFKRDTRRRYLGSELMNPEIEKEKLLLMDQSDPEVIEELAKIEAGPQSSQGNENIFATGPSDFDPTGLRSTMSVTWKETEKALDKRMPTQLPLPTWAGKEEEIIAWHTARDLPVPVGGYYEGNKVSRERRVAIW